MKALLATLFTSILLAGFAQTKIQGHVTDFKGEPIPLANIFLKDAYDGTTVDDRGNYKFVSSEKGYHTLIVRSTLTGKFQQVQFTDFQKSMFRAGHAHAGVLVILSLVCQLLADHATLSSGWLWFIRIGIPSSALLISGGFFFPGHGKRNNPAQWLDPDVIYWRFTTGVLCDHALGVGLLQ